MRRNKQTNKPIFLIIVLIIVFSVGAFWTGFNLASTTTFSEKTDITDNVSHVFKTNSSHLPNRDDISFDLLWEVWSVLQQNMYVEDPIRNTEVEYGMIKGMVASLGDKHTVFFDPTETENFYIHIDGELSGIGAEIGQQYGNYIIMNVIKNTPAQQSGLAMDDIIMSVDDVSVEDMDFETLIQSIRGEKGTQVTLMVYREKTQERLSFEITRDDIKVPAVEYEMKENNIGYVSINQFLPSTYADFSKAIFDLKEQQYRGLILDLRNNGGGYLTQAINIVSAFISDGTALQKKYVQKKTEYIPVNGNPIIEKSIPVVVLINGGSASASEITAGALQDYKRAELVGTTSYGKGTVQESIDLPGKTNLKFTVSKWLTALGNDINEKGITPDIEIENELPEEGEENVDEQYEKAFERVTEMLEVQGS